MVTAPPPNMRHTRRMASKTILIDDIDGSEGAKTHSFSIDGKKYSIDLSDTHYAELTDALAKFVAAGRVERRTTARTDDSSDTRAIREWAEKNGHLPRNSRGRIPYAVREAYKNR